MNAELLRNVIDAVIADYKGANLVQLLTSLETSYAQSVQSPSAATAEAFSMAMQALEAAVSGGECARLSASRTAILERVGAWDLCGPGLVQKIKTIKESADTPADVVRSLQELRSRAQKFYQTATALRDSLAALNVEGERPPADSAEVEVHLPFELFGGSLGGFSKETKQLDRALCDVVETVTGGRPPITIRALAGDSVEIFVAVDPLSGLAMITLVTAIVNLINSVMQTRKTRVELERDKAPKEVLEPLAKWEQSRIAEELVRLREDLLAQSKVDKGRKNELKKALGDSLRYLADRIDRGMDIEVATLLEGLAAAEAGGEESGEVDPVAAARKQIARAMNKLPRLLRAGVPVLVLPPVVDEDEEESGKSKEQPRAKT